MDKVLTRLTIVIVAVYFVVSYILAQMGIDILRYTYTILFELCVVSYTFCSGKFHCRYMRWLALSLLVADIISHTDYYFDYIPVEIYNLIPLFIIIVGIVTSTTLALHHFNKVNKIKKLRKKSE